MKTRWFAFLLLASVEFLNSEENFTEDTALRYLATRGIEVEKDENGFFVSLSPNTESQKILPNDILALNALDGIHEIRVIALHGVDPEVMKLFREIRELRIFAVHYGMPDRSLMYLNKFPNIETIEIWGDGIGIHHLPVLKKLKKLDYDSANKTMISDQEIRRIIAQPSLQDVNILRPISKPQFDQLKGQPTLRDLHAEHGA